ncbi:uncharacterized protein ARMOST_22511 [Armillaria ostoyae]|uniref:CxC2-like cysteine cluster KDZ transposase-associated domain-containing protein n=1 Tax=Armillaria ostoyae TaxID=47428 RepID=A0A284SD33_ARMOS|nr:uncharacterized protein ARMOST_22511 [Armillaria ostoyae]
MSSRQKHLLDHNSSVRRNVRVRTLDVTSRGRVKARRGASHVVRQSRDGLASSANVPDEGPAFFAEEPQEPDQEWQRLPIPPPVSAKAKRNRRGGASIASSNPLKFWAGDKARPGYRQEYLEELVRRKGRGGNSPSTCPTCHNGIPLFRCTECSASRLECQNCCVRRHETMPLHIVRQWNGTFFQKTSLRDLGLRVQLGHEDGSRCLNPERGHVHFTVIHVNGLHEVAVDFCNCWLTVPHRQQMLRYEWFPATVLQPRSATTFQALDLFMACTLTGKMSAFDFYKAMTYLTDALGLDIPKNRYKPLLCMVREYRHLLLLLRAGKGNECDGASRVAPGELAMECPACPNPHVNLPEDWRDAPPLLQYLYRKLVAIDANFRLRNLLRSDDITDPGLHTGLAYFVEAEKYKAHVAKYATQKDISTCSGFKTLSHAETKNSTGLRATGVVMCICGRHEMVGKLSVGDLQKGERYCNTDYVTCSALSGCALTSLFFTYDIACQWFPGLTERMKALPEDLRIHHEIRLDCGVPKLHCRAHKLECQCRYSMNIQPGVGRLDGEGIERLWAIMNGCASSTKEMGPGSRRDTLDCHFNFLNWGKFVSFGIVLARKLIKAREELVRQTEVHELFTKCLPIAGLAEKWTAEVTEWEADMSKPIDETMAAVRERLEEEERLAAGDKIHETSPCGCLWLGLQLEDQQQRIRVLADGDRVLSQAEATDLKRRRVRLQKNLRLFRKLQAVYIPGAAIQIARENVAREVEVQVEDEKIWLPSDFSAGSRPKACYKGLAEKEEELREAECLDGLETIRNAQRTLRAFYAYRDQNIRGQAALTRAGSTVERQIERSKFAEEKYRRGREALLGLRGPGIWESRLRPLQNADVESMAGSDFEVDQLLPLGEGHRVISWIWLTEASLGDGSDKDLIQAARGEWLKSRARVLRWSEEKGLLQEEMRRVRVSLEYRAKCWERRRIPWEGCDVALGEGVTAYADLQASRQRHLSVAFTALWRAEDAEIPEDDPDWVDVEDEEEIDTTLPASAGTSDGPTLS